ncbi:MAG: hypothetical protein Kow0063_16380 [Anaerolineae bacterium]
MSAYRITPLVPACLLLLGAAIILIVSRVLPSRRQHRLAIGISALALLSLFFTGSGYPRDVQLVRVLIEWMGSPILAVRVPAFEPYLWLLVLALLAISLAARGRSDQLSSLDQAMYFALTAMACGVVLAGDLVTLAFALLLFDGTAALFALAGQRPSQAVGRLWLGVLSSTLVLALTHGADYLTAHPRELGGLFSLTVWLRLGLYPLVEERQARPTHLGWLIVNLAVGLYLLPAHPPGWLVWLAGATTVLHGALAWLEPARERALAHAGHALAGGILTMTAVVDAGPGATAASIGTLAALVVLELAPRLGIPGQARPWQIGGFLPSLLGTASLLGVPYTLGWAGRGTLYRETWEIGAPGTLALVLVAEGAALSVLYRYWQGLLKGGGQAPGQDEAPEEDDTPVLSTQGSEQRRAGVAVWQLLGAGIAATPFLFPVLGPRLVLGIPPSEPAALSALVGLLGSLLWALFLGYGRPRLLDALPVSPLAASHILHLGWLLEGLGSVLDSLGRGLLRFRAIIEGEHYLAWAILLTLGLGLLILLR